MPAPPLSLSRGENAGAALVPAPWTMSLPVPPVQLSIPVVSGQIRKNYNELNLNDIL